jgi:hypothetical protein
MTKNTLGDLNGYLFEQLDRLNSEELKGEALETELKRGKAITEVAAQVIANGKLVLDAQKFMDDRNDVKGAMPKMLEG